MFKCTRPYIIPFLTNVFKTVYESGNFPCSWSKSLIVPIHKKGEQNDPGNYRGISLINSITKVFIGILTERLNKWVDKYKVINEAQAGFRKGYSVIDQTFNLQCLVQKYLSKKKVDFTVYL